MLVLGLLVAALFFWSISRNQQRRARPTQLEPSGVKTLEAREDVFRQLTENIRQVFWMADCKGRRFIYVSPAMRDVWLFDPQLILNDPWQWFASVHPADRHRAEEFHDATFSEVASSCEYRVIRPDGEIRFVRNRSFPVPDASGFVSRSAGILEDVTTERDAQRALHESRDELLQHVNELKSENRERRRAEEQLTTARDLAQAGSRAKSQFLSNVSHELRTPLNGIIGMLQIASETYSSDDQRECLESAASSAANLLAIVDDILDFSETDTGEMAIREAPYDLRQCVREVVKRMAGQAFRKKLECAWFVSANVPGIVNGDSRRLARVLTHLIENGIKFSSQGTVALEVSCIADIRGRTRLRFIVSDNGIGVPPDSREAIFDAFTQADGSFTRPHGGLGLGLAICSRLVTLMGGEMSLESEPGNGSRFGFTLPLGNVDSGFRPLSQYSPSARAVLIVDSDPTTCAFAKRALTEEQLAVICCSDQEQALSALNEDPERFAAILLASELAGRSGFELAEQLCRKYDLGARLLMTLIPTDEIVQVARCQELGIAHYFTRPIDYDDLRARLHSLIARTPLTIGSDTVPRSKPIPVGRSLRVLVVEDNPINQTVLKRMLQKQGHSVVTADHGLAALHKLEEVDWHIDLVLMDMQMPELDGYGATARIRTLEQSRGGHLPIIAATAHAMAGDAERCLSAGMDGYISKPIQLELLSKTIAKVLSNTRENLDLQRKVS